MNRQHLGGDWRTTESGLLLRDTTIANATAARHGLLPKLSGNALNVLKGDGTWGTVAGVSGSYPAEYDVRVKDVSPTAETDEFASASITGWTDIGWSGVTEDQSTTQPGALWVSAPSSGTWRNRVKAIPAGDFRLYTLVSHAPISTNFLVAGLVISSTAVAGTGTQAVLWNGWHGSVSGATWNASAQVGTNFNQTGATLTGIAITGVPASLLRITRSGSTYSFGASPLWSGGRVWFEKAIAIGFTPTHAGLFILNTTSLTAEIAFEFFRYYGSATANTGGAP
jgi:hypothetical protein